MPERNKGGHMMFDRGHSAMTEGFGVDDDALPTEAVSLDDVRLAAARLQEEDFEEETVRSAPAQQVMPMPQVAPVDPNRATDLEDFGPTLSGPAYQGPGSADLVRPVAPSAATDTSKSRLMMVIGIVLLLVATTLVVVAQSATKPTGSIVIQPATAK